MSESTRHRLPDLERGRALHLVGSLFLALIVLPFVAFAIPPVVGATGSFVVVSNSMNAPPAPLITTGDVVFVYDTPADSIRRGDVITYRSGPGQLTTHRVVGVRDGPDGIAFETKGDANEEADPELVPAGRVIGTVGFVVPLLGHAVSFASSGYGVVLLVVVPAALLILTELVTIVRAVRAAIGQESDGVGELDEEP